MEKILPAIISHSIGLLILAFSLIYLKRTQPAEKKVFGFSMATVTKIIYAGMACFILLIAATLIKGEPV